MHSLTSMNKYLHILTSVSKCMHILTSMNKYMHILISINKCMHILTSMNKYMLLSHEKSGKVKDVLAFVVGLRLTIFHSKFIWRIFHDNNSEISLLKLRQLFKHTGAVTLPSPSFFSMGEQN